MRWRLLAALTIVLVGGASEATTARQGGQATLEGRVVDENGAPLPGVSMVLKPPGGRPDRTVTTDAQGAYVFAGLEPGDGWTLEAFLPDYARLVVEAIRVQEDRAVRIDLTMKRSSDLEETVKVEARGELVDTSSAATSTTYNAEFIEALPLLGRRFSDLLVLAPGVTDSDGDGNPNVHGARDTGMQVRLDGTNITNPLTGRLGQQINLEAIEQVEIITSGAPAEYGRADGGFASVITKSGGNETTGSFKVFFRSDFLDGGAGRRGQAPQFNDTDAFFTLGGPVVRDHLWYFTTVERLDEQTPIVFPSGSFARTEEEGWRSFGKITWQASPAHKLALQINHDPLELRGNNIGPGVEPESDFRIRTGGVLPQLTWTALISPALLYQVVISHSDGDQRIDPVSSQFTPIEVERLELSNQTLVRLPCSTTNCLDEPSLFTFLLGSAGRGRARSEGLPLQKGPYPFESHEMVQRTTLRSDLSYTIEERLGQHAIKGGFEFNVEGYAESALNNPVLVDQTCGFGFCDNVSLDPPPPPRTRFGSLYLQIFDPLRSDRRAEGFYSGAYLQDSWRPVSNLALNLGLRFDHEAIDGNGSSYFSPVAEAREVLRRFDLVCNAIGAGCLNFRLPGRPSGPWPATVTPQPGDPALVFDLNGDGVLDLTGSEGALVTAPYTRPADRIPDSFFITNANIAPRLSISWDPASNGRTKLFATWGKFYDRLFLGSIATEQEPTFFTARWEVDALHQADPGSFSDPLSGAISISQTDRNVATPYTVEWSAGVERELAAEWAASLTFVHRRGIGLLQDVDVNHITCKGFDTAVGVDPMAVCGDGGYLELDRFGSVSVQKDVFGNTTGYINGPNGAPDLYVLNRRFNQILRVGNFNSSEYSATEFVLRKRLHRNWQMQLGYTYSRAVGDAESFVSLQGNDPAVSDKVKGYLDYDQRHVFKYQAAAHVPRNIVLGGTIEWASGLPYSYVASFADFDDAGNVTPNRVFSLTGRKNDQRNKAQLTINGRIEKRLSIGKTYLSGFLEGENLLDDDTVRLLQVERGARGVIQGTRRFGRRWEIGVTAAF